MRWAKRTLRGLAALLVAVLAVLLLSHSASAVERTLGERSSVVREVREVERTDEYVQPDAVSGYALFVRHHAMRPGVVRPLRDPAALAPVLLPAGEQAGRPAPPPEPSRPSRSASPALLQVFRC